MKEFGVESVHFKNAAKIILSSKSNGNYFHHFKSLHLGSWRWIRILTFNCRLL